MMLAIYCRISKRKEEGLDTSIASQKKQGIAFATSKGLPYTVYIDEGISGQKGEDDRLAFAQMLQDIKKGTVTSVYVLEQSRIERNPEIWHPFVYLIVQKKVAYYPSGVLTDLNDATTEFITGIMSLTNKMFAKLTGDKVSKSIRENLEIGKYHGMTAYGYKKNDKGILVVNEGQAKVVRRMYELSLSGIGSYTIANILNDEGVPTKYSAYEGVISKKDKYTKEITAFDKKSVKWRGNVVYDMITNTIYKGKLKLKDEFYNVPAIVTSEHWQEVNDNLEKNKKAVGKREEYKYLLNGLIYCENCGKPMRAKKRVKSKDSAYKCSGGMGCRGMSIEKLETFIIKHLFQSKALRDLLNDSPSVTHSRVEEQKAKLQRKQEELKNVGKLMKRFLTISDGDDEDDEFFAEEYKKVRVKKNALEKEIKFLEQEVSHMENNFAVTNFNNVVEGFEVNQGFDVVKASIHSLLKEIRVGHFKQDKGGYFIINIEYKRFEDTSIFTSDYQLFKWNWAQYHRNNSITEEEKQNDRELYEYLNGEEAPEDFSGYETSSVMHEQVIFTKDELITFN